MKGAHSIFKLVNKNFKSLLVYWYGHQFDRSYRQQHFNKGATKNIIHDKKTIMFFLVIGSQIDWTISRLFT